MEITPELAASRLAEHDSILLLTHSSPDGDTLGSAYAICRVLQSMGKKAAVLSEELPQKFEYLKEYIAPQSFEPEYIAAIDVAEEGLLPEAAHSFRGKIELCIDHHISNTRYAEEYCVEPTAAACAEVVFKLLTAMAQPIDSLTATALFTGLTTDTGCFRYSNVTPQTHQTAAKLLQLGAQGHKINKLMFETNTKQRVKLEQLALSTLEYFYEDKIAVMCITKEMLEVSGAQSGDTEGLPSVPRTISGVEVGITIREKSDGSLKASVRSNEKLCSASELCARFGGGGHAAAAGCSFENIGFDKAKRLLVEAAGEILANAENDAVINSSNNEAGSAQADGAWDTKHNGGSRA